MSPAHFTKVCLGERKKTCQMHAQRLKSKEFMKRAKLILCFCHDACKLVQIIDKAMLCYVTMLCYQY